MRMRFPIIFLVVIIGSGCGGGSKSGGGSSNPVSPPPVTPPPKPVMVVSSTSVAGGVLARRCLFTAGNASPALTWSGAPATARSFALVMDDPDSAPIWAHWLVVDLPGTSTSLVEDATLPVPARQGRTSGGTNRYVGPDPPSGNHTYRLRIYALSVPTLTIDLSRTWTRSQFEAVFAGSIITSVELSFLAGISSRIRV